MCNQMSILLNVFDVDICVLRATVCLTYNIHIIYHADKYILEFTFVIFLLFLGGFHIGTYIF